MIYRRHITNESKWTKPICIKIRDGKIWTLNGGFHREDGPAVEGDDGSCSWFLNDQRLDPETFVVDPELRLKYPELVASMLVYLVHNS